MSCADGRGDRPPRILCAGIAVHDHVFGFERFPSPGSKTRARSFAAVGGGCAANAAVAAARLGAHAALAAPLGGSGGDDPIGDRILADLARERIDCSGVVRVAGATSPISAILVDATGERLIVNHRDERLSDARVADPAALVAGYDAVLVDNRFADFVLPLCAAARLRGIPVVLDGDRPTQAAHALFAVCTHLVFAADGLRATAQRDDLADALRLIGSQAAGFVAVTDGERGTLWLERGKVRRISAYPVDVVDTTGAGDVFHGAFVLALAEGQDEIAAMQFATAAAALKCQRFGGSAGAPIRAEVDAFMQRIGPAAVMSPSA
ncbi:MAG TPA: PfkB family carbohydrate kinase [Xanthobacteraceae bacterium]